MNTLFLRLEGPLQSWGVRSRWGQRDTTEAPTKSGLLGLLGCALGLPRDAAYLSTLSDALRLGIRVDRPGTPLRDYHTTGGGQYSSTIHRGGSLFHDDPYIGGVLSPDVFKGRIRVKVNATTKEPETDVSERFYLADASFLAALQGDSDIVARCATAIQAPVWPVFLGRKSCVPTMPVFAGAGQHDDLRTALIAQPIPERVRDEAHRRDQMLTFRLLLEVGLGAGNRQNDNIGTPSRRVFHPRYIAEHYWSPIADTPPINTLEG
jgi:CRISPR system Cascade subunit CasD